MSDHAAQDPVTVSDEAPETVAPKKYLVGVLYYGPIDREHDRCVKQLHDHPLVSNVLELTGCPYIDIGRSIIATSVLDDPELGGLLFIDHDMVFEPAQAIATIQSAIDSQSVVGAAYSMRRPGRIIGGIDGGKLPEDKKVVFFEGGERLPANYLGMGMTAIPKSVLERLVAASRARHERQELFVQGLRTLLGELGSVEGLALLDQLVPELKEEDLERLSSGISDAPVVPFFSLLRERKYYYGEDVSFCIRCHQNDIPLALDTRLRVYHKGTYCYGLEDVGMEVPYCESLQCLDVADPKAAPALFSKHPEVTAALEAEVAQSERIEAFTSHPEPVTAVPAEAT